MPVSYSGNTFRFSHTTATASGTSYGGGHTDYAYANCAQRWLFKSGLPSSTIVLPNGYNMVGQLKLTEDAEALKQRFPNAYIVAFAEIWQGSLHGTSPMDLHYDFGRSNNLTDGYSMQIAGKSVDITSNPVYNVDGTIMLDASNSPVMLNTNLVPLFVCDYDYRATDDIVGSGIY